MEARTIPHSDGGKDYSPQGWRQGLFPTGMKTGTFPHRDGNWDISPLGLRLALVPIGRKLHFQFLPPEKRGGGLIISILRVTN